MMVLPCEEHRCHVRGSNGSSLAWRRLFLHCIPIYRHFDLQEIESFAHIRYICKVVDTMARLQSLCMSFVHCP